MCGLAVVILGTKRRRRTELADTAARFTDLLLLNERRCRHATGVALVNRDGTFELLKRPVLAHELVALDLYEEVLGEHSNRTTLLLGHTRYPTRGTPADPLNNRPIRRGRTLGAHNGTILNSIALADAHAIPRYCQVDTEVLLGLADASPDLDTFLDRLSTARGELAAATRPPRPPGRGRPHPWQQAPGAPPPPALARPLLLLDRDRPRGRSRRSRRRADQPGVHPRDDRPRRPHRRPHRPRALRGHLHPRAQEAPPCRLPPSEPDRLSRAGF